MKRIIRALCLGSALVANQVGAQPQPEGFLCCNMLTDGAWITDINYAAAGRKIIPVGTPVKVTGYGRYRAYLEVDGSKQALGNDYSRDLALKWVHSWRAMCSATIHDSGSPNSRQKSATPSITDS